LIIISAPFGNWLEFQGCKSTLGTFTWKYRGGNLYRLWRCIKTLRYNRRQQSWINQLGLPNPGIANCPKDCEKNIVSIYGFNLEEWENLAYHCSIYRKPLMVELNLSCPNVQHQNEFLQGAIRAALLLVQNRIEVIAKLPPIKWQPIVNMMLGSGVNLFHCCNTIPSPGGGLSGKILKQYSLWCIEDVKHHYPEAEIIGGGGITDIQDVKDYKNAGTNHIALGSMLFNPFNWKKIPSFVKEMSDV